MEMSSRHYLAVAGLAAAPLCAGAAVFSASSTEGPFLWPCPLRTLTGVPCPFCGATRSVVLATHGDLRFLDYNPWWVAVLILVVVVGVVGAAVTARGHPPPVPRRRIATGAVAVALAIGWLVALANASNLSAGFGA